MAEKLSERQLLDRAIEMLRARLPSSWRVEPADPNPTQGPDFVLTFTSDSSSKQVLVEVKKDFKPADLDRLLGALGRRFRAMTGSPPLLLVAERLSPRSRELLASENIGYLDLAGNVRLVLDYPGLFIEATSTDRAVRSEPQRAGTLRGARAGRLVRFLVDVRPGYGVVEIASATRISRGYVSRVLDLLADEALIERRPRGPVTGVDWPSLLRRRAGEVNLLKTNAASSYVAPSGARAGLELLRDRWPDVPAVVTGSFAAYRIAPVAAPSLLALYTLEQTVKVQQPLQLLPAEEGADVVVLRPPDEIAADPYEEDNGIRYAATSQVAIDCLSGPGRMPSEGEALIEWMTANEDTWRRPDIDAYLRWARRG